MISNFNDRQAETKQMLAQNWLTRDANIDLMKHTPKLAEIVVHKQVKKATLLEEITRKRKSIALNCIAGSSGRPIIVVPGSESPGNVCMKNIVSFLKHGKYQQPGEVELSYEDRYKTREIFNYKVGGHKDGSEV